MMATWNYRVMKDSDGFYNIHEVYYDVAGKVIAWTRPITETGAVSVDELIDILLKMLQNAIKHKDNILIYEE